MAEPFPLVPDYGWRRVTSDVPAVDQDVVVQDPDSEYYGCVGQLKDDKPGWQTVAVLLEGWHVQLYRRDVRKRTPKDVLRVVGMGKQNG
jgi:hypothetical protein